MSYLFNPTTSKLDLVGVNGGLGAVTSVSNSDGTLTISPTTGAVVASLNLSHANTWTAQQTFPSIVIASGVGTATLSHGGGGFTFASNDTFTITAGGSIVIDSASSTRLADLTTNGVVLATSGNGTLTSTASLSVSNGGTGSTSFTAGSIIFSNGTILTQDNSNLFWNDTDNYLGIGTSSPVSPLNVIRGANDSGVILSIGNTAPGSDFQFSRSASTGALSIQGQQVGFNNILLVPTSGNVGIGTTPSTRLEVSEANRSIDGPANVNIFTSDSQAINKGGSLGLGGRNGLGSFDPWPFAVLKGAKENGTSANFAGYLALATSNGGGTITEWIRIDSGGGISLKGSVTMPTSGTVMNLNTLAAPYTGAWVNFNYDTGSAHTSYKSEDSWGGFLIYSQAPVATNKITIGGLASDATANTVNKSWLRVAPLYNQASGTFTNTDLWIDRTETAITSGAQYLIRGTVGGTDKFYVTNAGASVFLGAMDVQSSLRADSIVNDTGLAAGTYTPTRSAEANMDANVTMTEAQYMRVGNTVTVSGRFTADPTLTATATSFEITLPVASNLGAAEDVAGTAFCGTIAGMGAMVFGVAANDTAKIQWVSSDVTSQTWSYTFTYQVI